MGEREKEEARMDQEFDFILERSLRWAWKFEEYSNEFSVEALRPFQKKHASFLSSKCPIFDSEEQSREILLV